MWQQHLESLMTAHLTRWAVPVAGLAVALGILVLGRRLGHRPADRPSDEKDLFVQGAVPTSRRSGERRANPRRKGAPQEVDLSHPEGLAVPDVALVLDRSTGGLCLGVSSPVAVGTVFKVSTRPGPTGCRMAIPVEVRSCDRDEEGWRLGCSFSQKISYNELILFG